MIDASMTAGVLLAFVLLFVSIYQFTSYWANKRRLRSRLLYRKRVGLMHRLTERFQRKRDVYEHLSDLLEALRISLRPVSLVLLSCCMLLVGIVFGGMFFQSLKGTLLLGIVFGLLPYTLLRAMLTHRRMQTQIDFLPAVELFYQSYLVTGERQVKIALQRTIEERRLLGPMQSVLEQLYRNLSVRGDDEASLRLLGASLGHVWADYFVHILRVSLTEGVGVSESLKQLISDMRRSRRANEQERNRLLEIRIANFTPVLFFALFVGINWRYNKENSYYYYFIDSQGRDMLLNALLLMFASFLMGLWLSRKKM